MDDLTLLQLVEKCLSSSRLIFLLADLRLLSSTGRIHTPFQHLVLDSDRVLRTSDKAMIAAIEPAHQTSGLTPCHMMALLLLEMNQTILDSKRQNEPDGGDLRANNDNNENNSNNNDDDFDDDDDGGGGLLMNLRMSRSDPILAARAEGNLHTLLRGYCATIREDLKETIPKVRHPNNDGEEPSMNLNENDEEQPSRRFPLNLGNLPASKNDAVAVRRELTSLQELIFEGATDEDSVAYCGKDELIEILEQAIESREHESLNFMETFFKPGSFSHITAMSNEELVWLHDWHPQKECTYAVSIDRQYKTVTLSFRGATTFADWDHSMRWKTTTVPNPIEETYGGRLDIIKLHRGYYRYLFRARKDTRTTKYDEIADKVEYYGKQIGDDYRVVVTGHSLGGALSTIFSFYASLEERFTRNCAIHVVTFGCPKVAGYQFVDAVRHQEDVGKLRIARFHNIKDAITHIPPRLLRYSKRGAIYFHVGLDIPLPLVRTPFFRPLFGQPRPSARFYDNSKDEWSWQSYRQQWADFYFFNIPVRPWMLANHHSLVEHQKRLRLAVRGKSNIADYTLEELYDRRLLLTKGGKKTDQEANGLTS